MASALVNNVGLKPESFLDCCPPTAAYSSFGWLSPRISFSRDFPDDDKQQQQKASGSPAKSAKASVTTPLPPPLPVVDSAALEEKAGMDSPSKDSIFDFEFRLDDPVAMLPADELFSEGKLVPLQFSTVRPHAEPLTLEGIRSPEPRKLIRAEITSSTLDPCVFSPKAPRCSSRWRELLGLKKAAAAAAAQQSTKQDQAQKAKNSNPRSLKHFLHRNHKSSSMDSSLNLPLLRDPEPESVSISARLSLSSSSSSGPDHEDLPRLSLDSDKPSTQVPIALSRNAPRIRVSKPRSVVADPTRPIPDHPPVRVGRSQLRRAPDSTIPPRGASVDSPRMNSYGKVVFQSLERSSSSPSTFNGGPRAKHRGMERSYSANVVRVTPVLNVPVCSLRGSSKSVFGFGQFFSPQKKESTTRSGGGGGSTTSRSGSGKGERGITGN